MPAQNFQVTTSLLTLRNMRRCAAVWCGRCLGHLIECFLEFGASLKWPYRARAWTPHLKWFSWNISAKGLIVELAHKWQINRTLAQVNPSLQHQVTITSGLEQNVVLRRACGSLLCNHTSRTLLKWQSFGHIVSMVFSLYVILNKSHSLLQIWLSHRPSITL